MNLAGPLQTGIRLVTLLAMGFLIVASLQVMDSRPDSPLNNERLYFPSGTFLTESTLGFREATADYLWFRFIQYYGAFAKLQNDLRYLDVLIDGITTLDPRFTEAYHFASLVKWSDFGDIDASLNLLKQGILSNPDVAKLHFQVGFIYYVVFNDYPRAATWFEAAGRCSDATDKEGRFAAFARYRAGEAGVSLELWKALYESTESPQMRNLAEKMVEKLLRKIELQKLYGVDFIGPIPEN